jgi:histone arginine demethylase JMJD6
MRSTRCVPNGPTLTDHIDRHEWSKIDRLRYEREYILALNPVIISAGFEHWPARTKWNLDFFQERYGDLPLVVDGRKFSMSELIEAVKRSMPDNPAPYLRNHSVRSLPPELQRDIEPLPECTNPNWLDSWFLKLWKDWTFLEFYIGGTGARFPVLHYDGSHTHAFLMQVEGVKEYVAFPPQQNSLMYSGNGRYDQNISAIDDVEMPDLTRFPRFAEARGLRFTLHPGETLYVPAGWWHTARILSPAITVSVNGANAASWKDFARDVCQVYWAGNKAKQIIGSAYLSLAAKLAR